MILNRGPGSTGVRVVSILSLLSRASPPPHQYGVAWPGRFSVFVAAILGLSCRPRMRSLVSRTTTSACVVQIYPCVYFDLATRTSPDPPKAVAGGLPGGAPECRSPTCVTFDLATRTPPDPLKAIARGAAGWGTRMPLSDLP